MTGKSIAVTIQDGITQEAAENGQNKISQNVVRAVSRVIVTTKSGIDFQIYNSSSVAIGTLSNVTYSVTQGTKKFYFMIQSDYSGYRYKFAPTTSAAYTRW